MIISKIIKRINKVFFHALFWSVSIFVFAFIFRLSEIISNLDVIYSLLFHTTIIVCVYLNFLGIRLWFDKGRYVKYVGFVLINLAVTIILNQYTFNVFVDLIFPDHYFVSQFNNTEIGLIALVFLTITSAIKLLKSWLYLQKINRQAIETEKEKIDSELQSLKSQINPHFLFNSLNVIYSLTLKKDESTPEVVLKLSDILRYVIYDSTQEKVLLSSEISLLKKYIDLQKYRIEDEVLISFSSEIEYDVMIAPLIFLTLLENSFKHGIRSEIENVFIDVKLYSNTEKVYFEIENNKSQTKPNSNEQRGVGLENIKKRLGLQYPDKHKLKVLDNEKTFKVYLEIEHEN